MVSGIVEVWYALLSCCPQSWIANAFPLFEMGIYQSPFSVFFVPHNFVTEISEWFFIPGNMYALLAGAGMFGRFNSHLCKESILVLSGSVTLMGKCLARLFFRSAESTSKLSVAPKFRMA